MYAKCFLIFFTISLQSFRPSASQSAANNNSLESDEWYDYSQKLRNFTQNVIGATLNDLVSIFNDTIEQTLEIRANVASNAQKNIDKNELKANILSKVLPGLNFGGGCSCGAGGGHSCKKDCCAEVAALKVQVDKLAKCYTSILSDAASGCANSAIWSSCSLCTNPITNEQIAYAIPKAASEKTANWATAKAICAKYGASLISIKDANQQACIESFLSPAYDKQAIWTSGAREPSQASSAYKWGDTTPIQSQAFQKWAPNQPDNFEGVESCIDINYQDCINCGWPPYTWNDANCARTDAVVCQYTPNFAQCSA